jgi:GT2 family glycosyltransferase
MLNDVEYYAGYRTSFEITGWCLVIHNSVIKQCNLFDERFKFWYQDNDYAETLKHANVPHALVTGSRVYHEISRSYDVLSSEQLHEMTNAQLNVFNKKWGI